MRRTPRALARLTSCPVPGTAQKWWQGICWPQILMMALLVAFAFGPLLAAGASAAPASPAAHPAARPAITPTTVNDGAPLDLEIISQSTPTLKSGEQVTFHVRITNVSAATVTAASVDLRAQEWTPATRFATARWADETRYGATLPVTSTPIGPLAPGQLIEVSLTASAEQFGVSGWGPRGVELRATPTDPSGTADRERSWITFWDGSELTATPLTVIAPLTASLAEWSDADALAARTAAILNQASLPGESLAVDPSVLALLPPDDRTAAAAALAELDVWALPWSDVDVRGLSAAGRTDLLQSARDRATQELTALGAAPEGFIDLDSGRDSTLLHATEGVVTMSSELVPAWLEGTFTPGGRATLVAGESDTGRATQEDGEAETGRDAVVADAHLANALAGEIGVDGKTYELTPANLTAYVVAQTAAYTRERPSVARPLVVVLPRDDDASATPALAALTDLAWVTPLPLADLMKLDGESYSSSLLPAPASTPASAVTASELTGADQARSSVALASELSPAFEAAPLLAQLDRVAALAWRQNPTGREEMIAEVTGPAEDVAAAVYVEPPSTINMVSDALNIPITVANTAEVPLTVVIVLDAPDTRLRQAAREPIEVPAGGHVTSQVPVTAVGSGSLTVHVHLETAEGTAVGEPVPIEVRLLIQWENALLIGLVALGVVTFVVGIIRTARRNRRTHRAEEIEAAAAELDAMEQVEDSR